MIELYALKARLRVDRGEILTSGMANAVSVRAAFSQEWDGLSKTAVFTDGETTIDIAESEWENGVFAVPHEVLAKRGAQVRVGLYGTKSGGTALPTIWAELGLVQDGADPSGDVSTDPTLPVWAQVEAAIGSLGDLTTEAKENLVAAINEAAGTGSGGSISMRTAGGYIQYSADGGESWENLIALSELKGGSGRDGTTPHIGDNGNWYIGDTDTGEPSRGADGQNGAQGAQGPQGPKGDTGPAGSDANVTEEAIAAALGYTPASPDAVVAKQQDAASAGKLLGIGEDGSVEPTERELLICTITGSGTANSPYACDKTTAEIAQAAAAGQVVYALNGAIFYPVTIANAGMVRFEVLNGVNDTGFVLLPNGTMTKFQNQLQATSSKVTSLSAASTDGQYPSAKCVYGALAEKLNKPETYEATFGPDDWALNSAGYYEQSVTVEGLTRDYTLPPDIDVKLSGTNVSEDAQLLADWALVSLAQVDNDTLALWCAGEPPASIELPVIVRVWQ